MDTNQFVVSALGPNKVSVVPFEDNMIVPKGSVVMTGKDFLEKFKGFRKFSDKDGNLFAIFFGDGLVQSVKNNWFRWLGLLSQESCKALWSSVVNLLTEFKSDVNSEGFWKALKNLWDKFLTWAKAKCDELWKSLVSMWEKFLSLFKKGGDEKEVSSEDGEIAELIAQQKVA